MNVAALGKIAVLMGGDSSERSVSLRSGEAVLQALLAAGADAFAIDVQGHAVNQLLDAEFDIAFIAMHGRGGEDGTIQGVLEWLNKPYTGSGVMASALAMDKWRTKLLWSAAGLPTPKAFVLNGNNDWQQVINALNNNAIVKPAREGSSIGMRRVHHSTELQESYQYACQYDAMVLAEAWVSGAEFTVAVVDGEVLPAIQLKTSHEFYDYEAKYQSDDTQYLLPCGLSAEKEQELKDLCLQAFNVLGCEGWARMDVMQDEAGAFWLLEANTIPGMTDHSLVPMAAKAAGMDMSALVLTLLQEANNRNRG
ncbi:MAG TPA: D-alanine--D-alanine ligase [Pseudomonadales bacterium]|nr:D-alanine--D-alanine ligase [Pseudomonadales bacterium]